MMINVSWRLIIIVAFCWLAIGSSLVRSKEATSEQTRARDEGAPNETLPPAEPTGKSKRVLFDGKSLGKWQIASKFFFDKHGRVTVRDGRIRIGRGEPASGIRFTDPVPTTNYEIELQAQRVDGSDFFCGLTIPIDKSFVTLIVGGWGGQLIGLSDVDDESAAENLTTNYGEFKNGHWYTVRVRVRESQIYVWIDEELIIDLPTRDRKFSIWWEQEPMRPLGIATWNTSAAIRKITLEPIGGKAEVNE